MKAAIGASRMGRKAGDISMAAAVQCLVVAGRWACAARVFCVIRILGAVSLGCAFPVRDLIRIAARMGLIMDMAAIRGDRKGRHIAALFIK